jgi:hypothetical protein
MRSSKPIILRYFTTATTLLNIMTDSREIGLRTECPRYGERLRTSPPTPARLMAHQILLVRLLGVHNVRTMRYRIDSILTLIDGGFAVKPEGGYTTPGGHEVPHEDMDKPWYDIRGDTKKEMLVSSYTALSPWNSKHEFPC